MDRNRSSGLSIWPGMLPLVLYLNTDAADGYLQPV